MAKIDNIQAWADQRGLEILDGSTAVMVKNGFTFAYSRHPDLNNLPCIRVPVRKGTWTKETHKQLKQAIGKVPIGSFNDDFIQAIFSKGSNDAVIENFETTTQILADELPRLGVAPADLCFYCGEGSCDTKLLDNGIVKPIHSRCKVEQADKLIAEIEDNQQNGSMLMGLLGAILGGIVGSLPSFLLMRFGEMVSGYLFALIPLASFFGYKIFKGVLNGAVPFIVSIISLLCTVALTFFAMYSFAVADLTPFEIARLEAGGQSLLQLYLEALTEPDIRGEFFSALVQPIVFCCLGIFIAWKGISRGNTAKRMEAQRLAK